MLRRLAVPALVLGFALLARLAAWDSVFTPAGVQFPADSDPHYHVLRAERWLRGAEGAPWRDPELNWPAGADVPWPPLFDAILAGGARAAAGPAPSRTALSTFAAWVPVALGLLLAGLVAALGRAALGGRAGWIAAFLVAGASVGADHSRLGRADQHALELVLLAALLLAAFRRARRPLAPGAAAALAALAAAAFWTWMGSGLHLLVVLAAAACLYVVDGAEEVAPAVLATLAVGLLGGAALLAASVALLAPAGALLRFATAGVGGLQVAMTAAGGLSAAAMLAAGKSGLARSGARRAAAVALSALVPLALLLAVPPVRRGLEGGLVALAASNPWYAAISEFQPLLGGGERGLLAEVGALLRGYGLVLVVAPLGAVPLVRAARAEPTRRPALVAVIAAAALLVPLAFARRRFAAYALVPLALWAEAGLRAASAAAARRWPRLSGPRLSPALLAAAALATVAPSLPQHDLPVPAILDDERSLLRWIASTRADPGREGVLAPWTLGHLVQFFAGRPVVTSPFGTEGGRGAMEDAATFWFAPGDAVAEAVLARRRCGLVLLGGVPSETLALQGFAPPGTPRALTLVPDLLEGAALQDGEAFWRLVPVRLYFDDGSATPALPALGGFRLLVETPETSPGDPRLKAEWKLFQPVAGARVAVRGAAGPVRASVEVRTNTGRVFEWSAEAPAGAELRLPYASGENGAVTARVWTLRDGEREVRLFLHEEDVAGGARLELDLATGRVSRRGDAGDETSARARPRE